MSISRRKFLALSGAAAGVGAVDLTAFAQSLLVSNEYEPNFPRLGLIANGGDQTYPPANWPTFAKFHVMIMGGNYEIWGDSRAYTREDVVQGIKAASSIGTKVFQYVDYMEIYPTGRGYVVSDPNNFFAAVNRNNWWLYVNGTSGATVPSTFASTLTLINMTHFSPPDSVTGLRPFEFAAAYSERMYHSGDALHPRNAAPSLDGFFLDNVFYGPRADGDYNRDGVTDSHTDPAIELAVRIGQVDFPNEMSKLAPQLLTLANSGSWAQAAVQANTTDPNFVAPFNNTFSGGVLEGLIGASFSVENYPGVTGFTLAMAYYRYLMDTMKGPKLLLVNQERLQTNGSDPYDPTPYHAMRYGLCLALMNDGYYTGEGVHGHTGTLDQIIWFDEYDGGGLGEGYLGEPTRDPRGAVQTGPRWNYGPLGVWAREFAGGIAILNPKGNGPQTLTLDDLGGARWKHLSGTQDPATNNGQNIMDNITLANRDGIILLRRHNLGF
jgi:hypothetical protein